MDAATTEQLSSLGYVSRTTEDKPSTGALPDPKDVIATFNAISRLQMQTAARRVPAEPCGAGGF
jgi:hypothetical protein